MLFLDHVVVVSLRILNNTWKDDKKAQKRKKNVKIIKPVDLN